MAASEDLIISELNKLTKKDIINILVQRRLPESVNYNTVVYDFFENYIANSGIPKDNNNFLISSLPEQECCVKTKCQKKEVQCHFYERENKLLNQTIGHLEKRLVNQEELISYLKNDINKHEMLKVNNPAPPSCPAVNQANDRIAAASKEIISINENTQKPSTSTSIELYSDKLKTKTTKTISNNDQDKNKSFAPKQIVNQEESLSNRKSFRNRRKPIIGSNKNAANVRAVPKLGYLHVYRLNAKTTVEELKDCLKETAPHINFECKELRKNEHTSSYMVTFPIVHVKDVYNPEIWPEGAAVNRFTFNKDRNFPLPASETMNP